MRENGHFLLIVPTRTLFYCRFCTLTEFSKCRVKMIECLSVSKIHNYRDKNTASDRNTTPEYKKTWTRKFVRGALRTEKHHRTFSPRAQQTYGWVQKLRLKQNQFLNMRKVQPMSLQPSVTGQNSTQKTSPKVSNINGLFYNS